MQGTTEFRLETEITYTVHRKCTINWTLPKHVLINYDITYVRSGNARYMINGKKYDVKPGDILCVPPGSSREAFTYTDRPMNCYAVNFYLKDAGGKQADLPFPLISNIGNKKDLVRFFNELNFTWLEKQPGYLIKIHGILMLILHRLFEICVYASGSADDDYRIKKAIRYISSHYPDKITVEKMAALTGLQTNYFNALFKQKIGLSMHQYLIRTRIRNAYNMLQDGQYKVAEIAERCGYSDIYHFYKQFKAIMDITPSHCIPKG
jgi:AraC-like DNA-binding protein